MSLTRNSPGLFGITGMRLHRVNAWLGLALLICAHLETAAAENAVSLSTSASYYQPLVAHTEYLIETKQKEFSLDQLLRGDAQFQPVSTPTIGFGVISNRIWLRFQVKTPQAAGSPPKKRFWRLDIGRQYYQQLDAYLVRFVSDEPQQITQILTHRADDHFSARPLSDRMLGVDFELFEGEQATIYIAYRAKSSSFMPLAIGSPEAVMTRHAEESSLNWVLNGALLAIVIFSLVMTPVVGWRLSASFAFYIFTGTLFVMHADGYTFAYLWPERMWLNDPLHLSFMALMPVLGLQFSRVLFGFSEVAPRFDAVIKTYMVVASCMVFGSFFLVRNDTAWVLAFHIVPLGSGLQLASAIVAACRRLIGSVPYFIGAILVVAPFFYAVAAFTRPGTFNQNATLDFSHFALLAECLAFAWAITLRLIGVRNERDAALTAELAATQERLRLNADLQQAQQDYIHARKLSDMRRTQLTSVSHDLQQPIASLRQALSNMQGADEQTMERMHQAFDYLESLSRHQLSQSKGGDNQAGAGAGLEVFPLNIVLDNVYHMFKEEAEAKGLPLRYRSCSAIVIASPIVVMRVVSNLLANAIKHTPAGTNGVLLAARNRSGRVSVEIWDSGPGLARTEIERLMLPNAKGTESAGNGLGLSIVTQLANEHQLDFRFNSRPGKGSVTSISLISRPTTMQFESAIAD